jgi:hypothetical protein
MADGIGLQLPQSGRGPECAHAATAANRIPAHLAGSLNLFLCSAFGFRHRRIRTPAGNLAFMSLGQSFIHFYPTFRCAFPACIA